MGNTQIGTGYQFFRLICSSFVILFRFFSSESIRKTPWSTATEIHRNSAFRLLHTAASLTVSISSTSPLSLCLFVLCSLPCFPSPSSSNSLSFCIVLRSARTRFPIHLNSATPSPFSVRSAYSTGPFVQFSFVFCSLLSSFCNSTSPSRFTSHPSKSPLR